MPISLASYYGVKIDETRNVMQSLPVHRPYGVAGRLPWQVGDGSAVSFGGGTPEQLAEVVQQVRTFTERIEEGAQLAAMRAAIANADRIVFLGFAFHRQNVELIAQKTKDNTEIFATAYQISASDRDVIESELSNPFEHGDITPESRTHLANLTCNQFFQEYWRTLTSSRTSD